MKIAIVVSISLFLLFAGYIYTCYYFNGIKEFSFDKSALRLTRNKVIYLSIGVISIGVLIVLVEKLYALNTIHQVKLISLIMIMLPIAAVDLREQKIPNKLLIVACAIRFIIYIVEFIMSASAAFATLKDNILGAMVIGAFFLLLLLIFKNSIGMGDIKLFAILGLYQGLWGAINSVFFSLMVSFALSIYLLLTKKKGRKDTISFGPCVLLGTVIAIALAGM